MAYSEQIAALQQKLNELGANPPLIVDGIDGPKTQAALANQDGNASNKEDYNKSGDTQFSTYGYTPNDVSVEREGESVSEKSFIQKAAVDAGIISSGFMETLTTDPSVMAFYVNSLTYGGYTLGDILNDMKRRELVSQGNTEAEDLVVIDPEINRVRYRETVEGRKSINDTASMIPTFNFQGLINPEILKYGSNMPPELFKMMVPLLDRDSQEFKDAVEGVKGTYYDLANASLQATSEREKAIADSNMAEFTKQINEQYGIALSDDAEKAWTQIEGLVGQMSTRGLAGSGLENEAIDNTLSETRKADQRLREDKLTKEEAQKASYYKSSASEAEIAGLTPEEREKYGLTPSADILAQFSMEGLRAAYPKLSEAEIKIKHDAMLDANDNYRSTIYSKRYQQLQTNKDAQKTEAEDRVIREAKEAEAQKHKDHSDDTAFLGQKSEGNYVDPMQGFETKNAETSETPSGPTPPPNMTSTQQKAWDAAVALIPTDKTTTQTTTPPAYKDPTYPTPPSNMTSNQQNAWNTATALIPTTNSTTPPASVTPNVQVPAKTGYQGASIVDYLSSVGQNSSYSNRKKLYGASGYSGSASQNTELLKKMRGY